MKLNLFTATYPYGPGESFINNELPYLINEFDVVNVFPERQNGDIQDDFMKETQLFPYDKNYHFQKKLGFSDNLFALWMCALEFSKIKNKLFYLKNARQFIASARKAIKLSHWILEQNLNKEDAYYSYWMNDWAIALAVLKKRGFINQFVFRVNGFDIYNERHEGNYLPFRYFTYKQTSKVYSVSQTTCTYIKNLNIYPAKISYSYFATKDYGIIETKSKKFTIFSCSSVIPLKRVDKIARIISNVDHEVVWVHHGDGPEFEKVADIIDQFPDHVSFVKSDKKINYSEVLEFQKKTAPDLFINLSSTEGLPVTVLESLCFGIPVLLNDVGSCAELVTKETGILVNHDEDEAKITAILNDIISNYKFNRTDVRNFWTNNFSGEKNYSIFSSELKQLFYESKR